MEQQHELVQIFREAPLRERADAARNREKVLAAAVKLFREHGVENVSMDAVATEAGVGKGTLFRRFGDKSGLVFALLDNKERLLQEAVLSGPPPLGPGAPPGERVMGFLDAYSDYLFGNIDLLRVSETATPGARYRIASYRFWHTHLRMLLTQLRPASDPDALAHALLALLGAEHVAAVGEQAARVGARELAVALVSG
ncbi:TetR/AcrR family transcriptional regulator [Acrocarpospora catenulata]|uniref:TetR/AcrR family transcriptional regulator n=1 Tax=Acrocarpospora catenulata TaxID=2836182 RepID=UPI001BDA9E7D|nr:TetR/AcrR family transcriptional regulator [Acrocarpospora catenulata]